MDERLIAYWMARYALAPRQREVALLAMTGMSYQAIADFLWIERETVHHTLSAVYRKCGLRPSHGSGPIELLRALHGCPPTRS